MKPADRRVEYSPAGPTVKRFHESTAFVRGIMGPIGSSKSTSCVVEILRRATEQAPGPDGKRHSRWAIIRNSYPELKSTTIKTWGDWVPPSYGRLTMDAPIRHYIHTPDLEIEVLFMALDRDEDVRKLLSLELTGGWLNEAREIPKSILDALTGRVGRYPNKIMGGCTWAGIIMDTNPPDDQSWWYHLSEEATPPDWEFFKQPAGDCPEAENLQNLPQKYYHRVAQGKEDDWIQVYVKGEYGFLVEGKPVYPMFRDRVHVSPTVIPPSPAFPILVGADFGLTPAAIFGQLLPDGRWQILDELCTDNHGIVRFGQLVIKHAAVHFPDHCVILPDELDRVFHDDLPPSFRLHAKDSDGIQGFGDPAGNKRSEIDERTALEIMKTYTGWKWRPAPSNEPVMRRESVVNALNRMIDGVPGLIISPKCKVLRKGFSSGYHYRYIMSQSKFGVQVHDQPQKNEYSHVHDALQYLLLGGGERNVVMNRNLRRTPPRRNSKPRMARDVDFDLF